MTFVEFSGALGVHHSFPLATTSAWGGVKVLTHPLAGFQPPNSCTPGAAGGGNTGISKRPPSLWHTVGPQPL